MNALFGPEDVISTYTRAQALEDGILVNVTDLVPDEPDFARQAGWKWPVAVTASLAELVTPSDREAAAGQSIKGRLWDVLNVAHFTAIQRKVAGDTIHFPVVFWCEGRDGKRAGQRTYALKAVVGPGDTAEPVLTFMLESED